MVVAIGRSSWSGTKNSRLMSFTPDGDGSMASNAQNTESLKEIAEREAQEAEAEFTLDTGAPPDEEGGDPVYMPPTPTADDKKNAAEVLKAIKAADILGSDAAVSGLLQLIDIHPRFTMPEEWPGKEDQEYLESEILTEMSAILIKGCAKLTIDPSRLVLLWRNKEKWTQGGKTVRGNVKSLPDRVRYLLDGKCAVVEMNFHHFKTLNPLQRTFALYHELRQVSADGGKAAPDFSGFYDEMEIFGSRVFREMMELARVIDVGSQVTFQHQLPLFEEE
jgi:hypothetical protein